MNAPKALVALTLALNSLLLVLLVAVAVVARSQEGERFLWIVPLFYALVFVTPLVSIVTFALHPRRAARRQAKKGLILTLTVNIFLAAMVAIFVLKGVSREEDIWIARLFYLLVLIAPIISVVTLIARARHRSSAGTGKSSPVNCGSAGTESDLPPPFGHLD